MAEHEERLRLWQRVQVWMEHRVEGGRSRVSVPRNDQETTQGEPSASLAALQDKMQALVDRQAAERADLFADLFEEAQRQGLVVTGQESPPEPPALKPQQRMGH